jgi:hypothetical protein
MSTVANTASPAATKAAMIPITRELLHDLPIDALKPSDNQHQKRRRQTFVKAKLQELAKNIAAVGIQQPITARPIDKAADPSSPAMKSSSANAAGWPPGSPA